MGNQVKVWQYTLDGQAPLLVIATNSGKNCVLTVIQQYIPALGRASHWKVNENSEADFWIDLEPEGSEEGFALTTRDVPLADPHLHQCQYTVENFQLDGIADIQVAFR